MKSQIILLLASCVLFSGCAHNHSKVTPDFSLALAKVETVPLGVPQEVIENEFGRPTDIAGPYPDDGTVEWFYADGDYNKASFVMDAVSKCVIFKFWRVDEGDAERKIETALARYPRSHFKKRDSKFINPHKARAEHAWYEDLETGISIRVKKVSDSVEAIQWCSVGAASRPNSLCIRD